MTIVNQPIFDAIKNGLLSIDPVSFCEKNLTLDGEPFRLNGNGYKPFADVYRYIGIKALEKNSKPVIMVKGRQVGATTMAAALECFFMGSGSFGNAGRPPIRVMHCFPQLELCYAYSKTKLHPMISGSAPVTDPNRLHAKAKSFMETKSDKSANDSLHFKQFENGNHLWIESVGVDGNRVRGRQLCLDTDIPTPSGFLKLRDLKEGDELFDENGKICHVTKLHPINLTPEAYKVTFDDGTTIDACAEHLWLTYTKQDRINIRKGKKVEPKIKNTKEILETLKVGKDNNHCIPNCKPVQYSKKELEFDPYLFGLWLGDGNRNGKIETADPEALYDHIPKIYLHSSIEQRLALLQGLMDSDGSCYKDGRCEFTQVRKQLAYDVYELILSLGIKARIRKGPSYRYDKKYKDKYSIVFMTDLPVFRLEKKLQKQSAGERFKRKVTHRFIKNIKPIKTKPMRCITVDSPSHLYLVTRNFIPTHNTVDVQFYDEVQDCRGAAIANAIKCLNQAKYGKTTQGVQVYFGTPKQRGSEYHKMWEASSQQYYYLGCEKCEEYFPLYTPGSDEWRDIWLYEYIVKCTHCGHEQDKRDAAERGKWIASKEEETSDLVGYHINQLYMPLFTKEDIEKQHPDKHPINTERAWQNEVLGEFFAGDASPITPDQIEELCADKGRKFRAFVHPAEEKKVYLGCDWGQKVDIASGAGKGGKQQGQSYSCVVVLVANGPKLLSIDFATRLKRNDLEHKKQIVEEMYRRYSVTQGIGDIGYANDLTPILQQEYGEKFLASEAIGSKVNGHIKYKKDYFPYRVTFERDYYIGELYDFMKKGHIRFPWGDYEKVAWLVEHCCSMEIKPRIDSSGFVRLSYVKGSTPNDGFMALLNAYLAYKFDITSGFSVDHPDQIRDDPNKRLPIPAITGYIPKL